MKLNISNPFWHVTGLGTLAGMRTFSAPVIVSHILSGHKTECLEKSPLRFMQSSTVASVLKVMALAELVADKLPATPNRIDTGGVVGRFLSGALAGACIYKATGRKATVGVLIGGTVAAGVTYGSYFLRKKIVKTSHIIDPVIGGIEDAVVIGVGFGLSRTG